MASLKKNHKKSYNVIKLNKTNKTVTIMSYLQLHAVLTHIYIVTQSQCSFLRVPSHSHSNNTDQAW